MSSTLAGSRRRMTDPISPRRCLWRGFAGVLAAAFLLPGAPVHAQGGDYVIAVGDQLQLDFLDDDADAFALTVGGQGEVQLPFLGAVAIAGEDLAGAHARIFARYQEQGIFLDPRFDLSILSMRQVSVIGDVQSPGFFDYRPGLRVEQAVGLAGGSFHEQSSEEQRALLRVSLEGELEANDSAQLRLAVTMARLNAQLAGAVSVAPENLSLPAEIAPDPALLQALLAQESAIIAAEIAHFEQDRSLIRTAIAEARSQIGLIEEQIVAQGALIRTYDDELSSSETLSDRGLVTAPVRARLLRQVADEHNALLRLETTLAATRRDLTGLEREELAVQFNRQQGWRETLNNTQLEAARLRAAQESLEGRIALLDTWSRRGLDTARGTRVSYQLRRETPDAGLVTLDVIETDPLQPGDVLIVRQERIRGFDAGLRAPAATLLPSPALAPALPVAGPPVTEPGAEPPPPE
ncbi:MAG: polysaccharide biosynthesis/export family protein, partial [Paracoccus sp. (in: a-proteobacteria)]|nr:polysaccharide biosynthesis/export family protein [Paracoccus sp. (in: a-proteobacteria)]